MVYSEKKKWAKVKKVYVCPQKAKKKNHEHYSLDCSLRKKMSGVLNINLQDISAVKISFVVN